MIINRVLLQDTVILKQLSEDSWDENSSETDITLEKVRMVYKENDIEAPESIKELNQSSMLFFDRGYSTPNDVEFKLNDEVVFRNKTLRIKKISPAVHPRTRQEIVCLDLE